MLTRVGAGALLTHHCADRLAAVELLMLLAWFVTFVLLEMRSPPFLGIHLSHVAVFSHIIWASFASRNPLMAAVAAKPTPAALDTPCVFDCIVVSVPMLDCFDVLPSVYHST